MAAAAAPVGAAVVMLVDTAGMHPDGAAAMRAALLHFGDVCALQRAPQQPGLAWRVALSGVHHQPDGKTVKLALLQRPQELLNLSEFHHCVRARLPQPTPPSDADPAVHLASALRAVINTLQRDRLCGVVHVLSPPIPSSGGASGALTTVLKAAASVHVHVRFTSFAAPPPSDIAGALATTAAPGRGSGCSASASLLHLLATEQAFKAELAALDNVTVDPPFLASSSSGCATQGAGGAGGESSAAVERLVATWWQHLHTLARTSLRHVLQQGLAPAVPLAAESDVPPDGLVVVLQLPVTPAPSGPAAATHNTAVRCTVRSRAQPWHAHALLAPHALPAGARASNPSAAAAAAQPPGGLPSLLQAECALQASELDQALLWGWPLVLVPAPAAGDEDDGDGLAPGAQSTQKQQGLLLLGALCQVLAERGQVLIATGRAAAAPGLVPIKQLFCLMPAAPPPVGAGAAAATHVRAPTLLLRRLLCREQLLPPPGEGGCGGALVALQQDAERAREAASGLADALALRAGALVDSCFACGCHEDLARAAGASSAHGRKQHTK